MVKIRCAIYTRKSSEDGLDMDFNTLDAQREAGENYVLSQKHEGWILLPEHYDDGGFSGGNTNRPAFKKLMQDVESGLVDMIVVYKIDRLTRSLIDFSKMVEVFDTNKVSFVSVTQQFNTSTSMGRLTLNMLLSFAQFEREVSGERIRDKIAASKQKGMFMGGLPVLGYDIIERKLVINQNEAKIVKEIFNKYLQLHSYLRVAKDLNNQGFHTKQWQSKKGNFYGNRCFDKTVVASVIKNPVYIGKIKHKDKTYDGQQEAIIDIKLWDKVQQLIEAPYEAKKIIKGSEEAPLLKGLLRCSCCNQIMIHTVTKKKRISYRYYVSIGAMKSGYDSCKIGTIPALEIENLVINEVKKVMQVPEVFAQTYKELLRLNSQADENLFISRMRNFTKVWEYLYPIEIRKIVKALIKEVMVFEDKIEIKINIDGLNCAIKEYCK